MSSPSEGFKCSICLEFYSERGAEAKDYFVSTAGGHVFHNSCIKKLINAGHTCCPMCREHLSVDSLTRLYGIDPSPRPERARSCNSGTALANRNVLDCDGALGLQRPDYVFKLVLLGSSSVGKSSILKRFTTGEFQGDIVATTGCDLCFRLMEMGGRVVKLTIWDTVGQEKFRAVATNCVRNAHGVMLVYDLTDAASFVAIKDWVKFVDDYGPSDVVKILIGNKVDVSDEERSIARRHGTRLATKLGLSFFETSAKEANNVEAAFRCLVGEVMESTVLNPESSRYDDNDDGNFIQSMPRSRSTGCRIHLPSSQSSQETMPPMGYPGDCIC